MSVLFAFLEYRERTSGQRSIPPTASGVVEEGTVYETFIIIGAAGVHGAITDWHSFGS